MNIASIWRGIKKASPIIFSVIAAVGTVAAPILAAKGKEKKDILINEYRNREHRNPTGKEARKIDISAYKWAGLTVAATLGCIAAGTAVSWKTTGELTTALAKSEAMRTNLKSAALATGGATYSALTQETAKRNSIYIPTETEDDSGKDLWFDENNQHYFRATEDEVKVACMFVNKRFADHGEVYVRDFYDALHKKCPEGRKDFGWFQTDKFVEAWCEYSDQIYYSYSETVRPLWNDEEDEMCKEPCRFIATLQEPTHISCPDSVYDDLEDGLDTCFNARSYSNIVTAC